MEQNSYNIPFYNINNDLNNIIIGKYHYNYLGIDFMLNYKEQSEKLLIVFHARVEANTKLPVFNKYNYEKENISVLSISDKLLEKYQHILSTCYCDSVNDKYHEKYFNIIKVTINKINAKKNIFVGSCSGGAIAIYFGLLFNEIILCTNSYIYYDKFIDCYHKNAKLNYNTFVFPNLENILKNNKPKHIYLYINKNDNYLYQQNIKFLKCCKEYIPNNITYEIHDTYENNLNCHLLYFPNNKSFDDIIQQI
jgi:hypothetical protein